MQKKIFFIKNKSKKSLARNGQITFGSQQIKTPVFMPIGTLGSVKSLSYLDLEKLKASIILGNTYHLWLKPGMETLVKAKGLHNFVNWKKFILTDSGGFQAWSLTKDRKFIEEGVIFRDSLTGKRRILTPEKSIQIQTILGSNIALVLDQVVDAISDKRLAQSAMERTLRWAERSKKEFEKLKKKPSEIALSILEEEFIKKPKPDKNGDYHYHSLRKYKKSLSKRTKKIYNSINSRSDRVLFGIPQGAQFPDLRKKSAELTRDLGFAGYSIGGVAQGGEPEEVMYSQVLNQVEVLEDDKPKHLLGVGTPKDILEMVKRGIDMFDCVYPTRNARHGSLFVWLDKSRFEYETIKIKSKRFEYDFSSIKSNSIFPELQNYTKSYLSHLFKAKEILAYRLATLNNLEFYFELMEEIRNQIDSGKI